MWSNFLDSDVIKDFVSLGTELIKIVDNLGLIPSALVAVGSFKGLSAVFKILKSGGLTVKALTASLWSYLTGVEAVNAVNVKQILTEKILRANWIQSLATQKLKEIQEKKLAAAKAHLEFVQTRYIIGVGTAEQVERAEMLVKEASVGVDISKISTTELLSLAFQKLAANIRATIKALAPLALAGLVIWGVTKAIDALTDTTKELKEEYDEFNSTLDETKSTLSDIESELRDIGNRIEEINSKDSLSFTDQEELQRLQLQTAELTRQKELYEILQGQQATKVNGSAIEMAKNYENVGVNSGKTTEERVAGWGAGVAITGGVAGGIVAGALKGSALLSWAGPWGLAIGAAIGAIAGGVIGFGIGAALGENEEKVGDSLDNMKSEYERLQSEYNAARVNYQKNASDKNKKKFEEAQEAFNTYQSNMAGYMTEMDSYYSQIKQNWEQATTDQKKEYIEWQDTMDTWAIQTGGENAKSNMFARIFGEEAEGNFAKVRDRIAEIKEEIKEAQDSGDEKALEDAMSKLESFDVDAEGLLDDEDVARIREMGAYLYEAEDYFKDVVKAESDFVDLPLEDVAKDINKIAGGLDSLKEAFDEVVDKGYLTYKTLLSLQESLGGLLNLQSISQTDDKEVLAAWKKYQELMMSGAATTEQMTDATEDLAKAILNKALESNNLTPETKWEYIVQLQGLGVENAQEYVEEMLRKNMTKELELDVSEAYENALKKAFDDKTNGYIPDAKFDEIFDNLGADQLAEIAEEYGVVGNVASSVIDEIAEKYDTTAENVQLVIDKLNERKKIEAELAAIGDKQGDYNEWLNGDGVNKGILAIKEEFDVAKKGLGGFNPNDWSMYSYWGTFRYRDKNGNELLSSEYEALKNKYDQYLALKEQYDALWKDGESNGYIIDGNIVNPDFQAQIDKLQSAIDGVNTAINSLTPEIQLKLNLQNFDEGVDKIQDAYSTLKDIATEYNTQGYLSLDNLQALLNMSPEYLACLQMENGQMTINQTALQSMLETKLDDAEATAVQTAITQLNALAQRKESEAIIDSGKAAGDAILNLGTYSTALGTVAQSAIGAAGSVVLFNEALEGALGAKKNGLVTDDEINQILSNFNTSIDMINSVRNNLASSFNNILDPGSNTSGQDVAESEWERLNSYYENQLALITNERDLIEAEIDKAEARGGKASAEYYEDLIRTSTEEKTLLEEQYAAMKRYLDANADTIDQDTWTEYNNSLNEIAVSIKECETNTIQWKEALREIDIHYFEQANDEISRLGKELDFVNGLLEDEEVADENGNWSSAALTRMGMYMNQIEAAAADTQRYQDEIAKLNQQYAAGELSEEQYQDRLATLTDGLYDSINAQEDARDGIVELNEARIDAIKEGIEKEIEAYEDLIDAQKEELEASRDLYDFKNKIKGQTKDIAELERRIASLSGSSAASDIAERRKLEAELQKQKEALSESYYDHAQDARSNALDDEAEAYRTSKEEYIKQLEEQLEDTETLIYNSMMDVLLNADTVYNELNGIADTYGITLSEELRQPWQEASDRAKQWKSELEGDLTSLTGEGGAITLFSNGVSEKLSGAWDDVNDSVKMYSDFLTGSELGNKFSNTITGFANQIQKIIDKWTGVKDAADRAYIAQVTANSVGGNGNNNGGNNNNNTGWQQYTDKKWHATATYSDGIKTLTATGEGSTQAAAEEDAKDNLYTAYYNYKRTDTKEEDIWKLWDRNQNKVKVTAKEYAKGTTGTSRDQLAIVDELGPELILHADPTTGRLQYLTKGSGVVPHDATAELMKLADIGVDGLMMPKFDSGVSMMANYITKPEFKIDIEEFVHVDRVDQDTLPKLEKMMDKKIDDFSRALNYSIKKFAR